MTRAQLNTDTELAIAASTVLVDKESCMLYTSFPKDNLSKVCYK